MANQTKNHFAFRANSDEVVQSMLERIGLQSLENLFDDIPPELKIQSRPKDFPKPHSELEAFRHLFSILSKNKSGAEFLSFIGSGLFDHYVPAVVEEIQNRSEFKTSYTPYAPEMSQGLLTALYEYQSMVCELTGLEAANNSTYDWATAIGEAALMCARIKNHKSNPIFLVAQTVLPERYETLLTYTEPLDISIESIPFNPSSGQINIEEFKSILNENVVGVYIESPNLFGVIEENIKEIIDISHSSDALAVIGIDPISLAVLESPGNLGADICVGEGQALGNAPNFGGPLLGIFTSKAERNFIRNLPGRVIGYTKTKDGSKDAYVMTLQTREQHIRREKATSNICSNEALFSVSATAYLALLGPKGLEELSHHLMGRVGYILEKLNDSLVPYRSQPHFKEFLLKLPKGSFEEFRRFLLNKKVLIGKNFGESYNKGDNDAVVISISEKHSLRDLDKLADAILSFSDGRGS
jgi:glycine dehydrogenase subunit 1